MNDLSKGNLNVKVVASIVGVVILAIVSFYKVVVIPINNMQLQLAEIQLTLAGNKEASDLLSAKVNELDSRIGKIEDKTKK